MEVWMGHPTSREKWFKEDSIGEKETSPGEAGISRDRQTILFRFYKKPMATPYTILRRSAIPENTKVATMSAEISRRLKRTSTLLSKEDNKVIIREFVDSLLAMGYPTEWIRKVLEGAMKGYMRVLKLVQEGKLTRNRSAADTALQRRFGKVCGSQSWFKVGKEKEKENTRTRPGRRQGEQKKPNGKVE